MSCQSTPRLCSREPTHHLLKMMTLELNAIHAAMYIEGCSAGLGEGATAGSGRGVGARESSSEALSLLPPNDDMERSDGEGKPPRGDRAVSRADRDTCYTGPTEAARGAGGRKQRQQQTDEDAQGKEPQQ